MEAIGLKNAPHAAQTQLFPLLLLVTFKEVLPPLVKLISEFWNFEFVDDIAKINI